MHPEQQPIGKRRLKSTDPSKSDELFTTPETEQKAKPVSKWINTRKTPTKTHAAKPSDIAAKWKKK